MKTGPTTGEDKKQEQQEGENTTMNTIKREVAKETGKISIRVEGFADEQSARDYVQSAVKPGLAQAITKKVTRDGNAFLFESITCQSWDGTTKHTSHCYGTEHCIED